MWLCRLAPLLASMLFLAAEAPFATAQPGPPCGPDLPIKCDPGKSAAILLGFVGAGVAAAFIAYRLDHPKHEASLSGCVTDSGGTKTLTEDETKTRFVLTHAGKKLKAGERVLLRGKKASDPSGTNFFQVRKVVRDQAPCETQASTEPAMSP